MTLLALTVLIACSKKEGKEREEAMLYGKWEMGPGDGDTIEFLNRNGRNILRFYDARFISGIYAERAYQYTSGALSIQMYPSQAFTPVTSFTWQRGSGKFSVMSNELYPLLSQSVILVYNKIH
jgi:hypothetical protein